VKVPRNTADELPESIYHPFSDEEPQITKPLRAQHGTGGAVAGWSIVCDGQPEREIRMSIDALVTHVMASTAIIIGVSYLSGAALRRLRQPEVIGQIFAGIALGPSILGQLPGHLDTILVPRQVVPYLTVVAQIALVLFLFAVGYQLDLRGLRRQRQVVPIVALMAFTVPMLLGGGSALAFGSLYLPSNGTVHRNAFVLFIAVAMSITAVPVLASIIAERRVADSRPGVVAMTSAGMIDAIAWLALLVVLLIGGTSSAGDRSLPMTLAMLGGYVLVMVNGVRPALRRWLYRSGAPVPRDVSMIVAVAMTSAWATSALGLHVIFGAFLAGLIMPRTVDGAHDAKLVRPLQETGNLLLPMFFVVAGLPVDIGRLHAQDFPLLGIVCAIAIVGKIGGGTLGARLGGMAPRDATVVGVLLNTRGLTELIALNIGLQAGIIDRRLYTILVMMALLTTVLTGPLLSLLRFPRQSRDEQMHNLIPDREGALSGAGSRPRPGERAVAGRHAVRNGATNTSANMRGISFWRAPQDVKPQITP
jgi:Kef-type K+ transport system membrane component KefB